MSERRKAGGSFYSSHLLELTALAKTAATWERHVLELKALAKTAASWERRYPPIAAQSPHPRPRTGLDTSRLAGAAVVASRGFDWTDAGVGGSSGFGAAVALAAGLLAVLRTSGRRVSVSGPRTPEAPCELLGGPRDARV
jgi:hypothetical protein